jgi:hypothetical protein
MPYIDKIVDLLNDSLAANQLKGKAFSKGQFFGLCKQLKKDSGDSIEPVIYSISGHEIDPFVNDTYPFQIYHRILNTTYAFNKFEFGDGNDIITETTTMAAVVFAITDEVKETESDLAFLIATGLSSNLSLSDLDGIKIARATITPVSANLNSEAVFKQEYGGDIEYKLNPKDIYFSINYTIVTEADKNCIICESC